jgi:hypothetical protein
MYCPQCGTEYREHFTECSDCHVALLPGVAPPEPPDPFDPKLDLVVVLETSDSFQLSLAKGALEDAGIPFFVLGQITKLVNDIDPFLFKLVRIQVPRDREDEARKLLDGLFEAQPIEPSDGEAA